MNPNIRIGLIEDQFLFREGIKAILSNWEYFKVIFESADGYSVKDKLNNAAMLPDVMLVDLSLPPEGNREFSGLDVTRYLTDAFPEIKILVLSVHDDDNFINQLIEHGAHGYLVKDCNPQEVHDAILSVYQKGSYINEQTLKAIQRNMGKKTKSKRDASMHITKREEEILQLVCQQYTAEEIAEKLFISIKTVNGHRNNLLQKTGSRNVTGLVLYAVKYNIITIL